MSFLRALTGRFTKSREAQVAAPEPSAAPPMAFYLDGSGRMQAIKSDGYHGGFRHHSVGMGYVVQHAEEYARASIASVWAANCINLRADTIARLDWFVQDRLTQKRVDEHPFELALRRSKQNIMRKLEWSYLTWGETFLKPLKNPHGYHSGLYWLNNLAMDVDTSQGYVSRFMYAPAGTGKTHTYNPDELVFIKTDNPYDDNRGLSKFEHILLEINIDRDISRSTRAFYANDARPGLLILLENDITIDKAQEFTDYWNAQLKGPSNKGRTLTMPKVVKDVKELQQRPSIDDVELRESTRREICAAFKVPLSLAGGWDDANYQSLPEQRKAFYEETIIPEAEILARELTQQALPYFDDDSRYEVTFNPDTILALIENVQEKVDIADKKLKSGGFTLNEYRASLDADPVDGGDFFIMQAGWIPVRSADLATFEAPNTAPPDTAESGMVIEQQPAPPTLPAPEAPDINRKTFYIPHETTEVKTIHEAALKEVREWRKFHANGTGQKRAFANYMLRDEIAEPLRLALLAAGEDSTAVKAAFAEAEAESQIKAISKTQHEFETALSGLIHEGRKGKIDRRQFTNALRKMIREFGEKAFRDGLADGGVIIPHEQVLDIEDVARIELIYHEQVGYAKGLADQIYKQDSVTETLAQQKPAQWWAKTILPFYDGGLLSSARNEMVEYTGPVDDNSCGSCKVLTGQRHRRKAFAANGFMPPYGSNIICSPGGLCRHRLTNVAGRPRGSLARVPRH